MGLQPEDGEEVLPIDDFLEGECRLQAHDAEDVTPLPTMEMLEDEVVFLSLQTANRLGVRPAAVVQVRGQRNFFQIHWERQNQGDPP